MRRNGFSKPYTALQVATWVTLPVLVLQFLFFISPLLPIAASIPCTLIYFGFAVASAYYAYMACKIDPIDSMLEHHLNGDNNHSSNGDTQQNQANKKPFILLRWLPKPIPTKQDENDENSDEDHTKHCWVCDTRVHELSMHCKYCDKCVAHFDHHCQWLNTCVGQANYPYFYATLWAISGMLFIQICIMIALVIDNFLKGGTEQRADDWFNANASVAVTAVNIFFIVFCGIALSLVVQLLVFHISLQKQGLTTYQYIVKDNAKNREKAKAEATRNQKRTIAISKARAEGKNCLACRLMMGEYSGKVCQVCDPLPPEPAAPTSSSSPTEAQTTTRDVEEAQFNNGDEHVSGSNGISSSSNSYPEPHEEEENTYKENNKIIHSAPTALSSSNGSFMDSSSSGKLEFMQVNGSQRDEEEETKKPEEEFVENENGV